MTEKELSSTNISLTVDDNSAPVPSTIKKLPEPTQFFAPGPADPDPGTPEASTSTNKVLASTEQLFGHTNALAGLILVCMLLSFIFPIISFFSHITKIKDDWANYRCNPLIMPFASLFDYNTKENFEFCMGKIFTMHSASSKGSMTTMFAGFSGLLGNIFDSINSMRNTIATLGGGINVVFQEFTDRISMFFFTLRMSAMRLKMLFGRIYAILFSVMYMSMSGVTGMSSFTNTYLFSFLDTFCFPGSTEIIILANGKPKTIPIKDVQLGDVLIPGNATVTGTFKFYARGQPMVKLGSVIVSTNHYMVYKGKYIKAGNHPHAIAMGPWNSDDYLYCLNTDTNRIPVGILQFMDYDETSDADHETMRMIEGRLNSAPAMVKPYPFRECGFAVPGDTCISCINGIKQIADCVIGDKLTTGATVVGVITKVIHEYCVIDGISITPSTLFWDGRIWKRFGEWYPVIKGTMVCHSLIVTPNSQIEFANGLRVRDYMELCSPDAEMYYTTHIEKKTY